MVKVWFPSMYMRLISLKLNKSPPQALLRVPPSMTKTEVKEYLTKIYNIDVTQIMTANYLGSWKRFYAKRRIVSYKRRNFKTALVYFNKDGTEQQQAGSEP
jgi:large subunit ribosomal protein L23